MRKELDDWRFPVKAEEAEQALRRFLIGFEELRARLAPSKYPNIEISDEGFFWFNIDTPIGIVEVLAFPFGFEQINAASIAVSLPREAEALDSRLLNKLHEIVDSISGVKMFANKSACEVSEILSAYRRDEHPELKFTSDFSEILEAKERGVFFSYLGVFFSVNNTRVSDVESMIRKIILKLEEK